MPLHRSIVRRPLSCLSTRGALAVLIPDISFSNTTKVKAEIQEMLDLGIPGSVQAYAASGLTEPDVANG